MNLKVTGVGYIHVFQEKNKWQDLVNAITKRRDP
jgi:hypothetical protein